MNSAPHPAVRPAHSSAVAVAVMAAITHGLAASSYGGVDVVVAPLAAVSVHGANGSDWHDRQLLRNPTTYEISGTIWLVERGAAFVPGADPSYTYDIEPGQVITVEGLYSQLKPSASGAGTLYLIPDNGEQAPIWRSEVFNRCAQGEFGTLIVPFYEQSDGYRPTGSTLSNILSGAGYRDNPFLITSSEGMVGKWIYRGSLGSNTIEVPVTVTPYTTFQYTGGVKQIIGFDPTPGAQLDFIISEGSGRVFLTRTNNITNDTAYDEFDEVVIKPRIIGVAWAANGPVLDPIGPGGYALQSAIAVSSNAPFPLYLWLIVDPPGSYSFVGMDMPPGMGLAQGTGEIVYDPPFSSAGSTFVASFFCTSNTDQSVSIVFKVTY